MKGRIVLLDEVAGRKAAALMVDGRLEEFALDPTEGAPPAPGTILRAICDRPLKGQGGMILKLPNGAGFLRQGKGFRPGQPVLVQVTGLGEDGKATPVTTRLLFKSRYAIVTPGAPGLNIARSIRDEAERDRLLEIAHASMEAGEDLGLILRSAAEGVAEEALADDITAMAGLAKAVLDDRDGPPECLLDAPDAHLTAWRDWSVPDPDDVLEQPGCFADAGVLEAVEALLVPQMPLPGGASAMVEPTSALVAVDVNTGPDTSLAAGLKANFALARDLPRQLRLRGLAGQITLDVAPMPKKDRRQFEDALRRAFRGDATDTVLAGWTPLGHFELQRKRDRWPLTELWPG
ncbi:ribonuclease G [Rhodophyticola sp. CCM32]|uniref:ribonuclease E/G n=1 Tax=Rhodophyticola sp. CCM32 TaxID=2916397 RepID=UPI00107F784C|nr:ribonuclease E/G [Rhodophyticola sp. CCM32]QBY00115.1 ribonuclease G [Rhodophyticola sp. CCM32]